MNKIYKTLTLTFCILTSLSVFSQSIDFKATDEANVTVGKEWDFTYSKMKTPININFDGKVLKMIYESGKKFAIYEIKNVRVSEKTDLTTYSLETSELNNTIYVILKISKEPGFSYSEVLLPYLDSNGMFFSYSRYQSEVK